MIGAAAVDWVQLAASQAGSALIVIGYLYQQRRASERRVKEWAERGKTIDNMIASWEHVAWNLRLNGFELERHNEPPEMQERSLRDLVGDVMMMVADNRADILDLKKRLGDPT